MNKLQRLYDSEINFVIDCFYDVGFTWALGDKLNGFKDRDTVDSFEEAVDALWAAAREAYPDAECFKEDK